MARKVAAAGQAPAENRTPNGTGSLRLLVGCFGCYAGRAADSGRWDGAVR